PQFWHISDCVMYCTIAVNSALRAEFNCAITFSSPCICVGLRTSLFCDLGPQAGCDLAHKDVVARQHWVVRPNSNSPSLRENRLVRVGCDPRGTRVKPSNDMKSPASKSHSFHMLNSVSGYRTGEDTAPNHPCRDNMLGRLRD